jgi:hypothetical protein
VGVHLIIGRDGLISQLAPFNRATGALLDLDKSPRLKP